MTYHRLKFAGVEMAGDAMFVDFLVGVLIVLFHTGHIDVSIIVTL